MTTLEEAKAFLQQEATDGSNLYDHLSEVLLKILVERPEGLVDTFENLSVAVKQQRYQSPRPQTPVTTGDEVSVKQEIRDLQERWCSASMDLFKLQSDGDDAPLTEPPTGVADLLDEANMFEWAGLGFSRSEAFRLAVSMQRLAQTQQTSTLRLWGKILGIGADFYIVEGELPSQAEYEPEDQDAEEGPQGVNRFTYWAMKDDGQYSWTQLPNIQRHHILVARHLHRFIHADLDAAVPGHPPFLGTEKHFLRAQIARISSSTVVCPGGYFSVNDDGEVEPVEEPTLQSAEDLQDLSNWVHFTKEVNAVYGRSTPMPAKTNADGEEESWEGEEFAPLLRPLNEDTETSWRVDRLPGTVVPAIGEFAVLRSLVWPGAVSIAAGKKFLNVYVGHGLKYREEPYQPPLPLPIQPGAGVGISEATEESPSILECVMPMEQPDVLEDPNPPEPDEDE